MIDVIQVPSPITNDFRSQGSLLRRRETSVPLGPFWDYQSVYDPIIVCDVQSTSLEWHQIERMFFNASETSYYPRE